MLRQDAPKAPDDVWKKLSSQLDLDAAEMRLNEQEKNMIEEVWQDLDVQLDIDQVWNGISGELDKDEEKVLSPKTKFPYWAVAAAILLLILMGDTGLVRYLNLGSSPEQLADVQLTAGGDSSKYSTHATVEEQNENKSNQLSLATVINDTTLTDVSTKFGNEEKARDIKTHPKANKETNRINEKSHSLKQNEGKRNLMAYVPATMKTRKDESREQQRLNLSDKKREDVASYSKDAYLIGKDAFVTQQQQFKPELKAIHPDQKILSPNVINGFDLPFARVEEPSLTAYNKKYSKWSTGVVTAVKNTYLLNSETKDGFSATGMNESKITVMPDIGLNVQYALSPRYVLSTNLFFTSSLKQKYNTYSYGEYVSKQLQLDYWASELAIKQNARNNIFSSEKIVRRNIVGFYVAALRSASQKIVNEPTDITSKYTRFDYGLVLGQEIEFVSHGPITVSSGLTFKYGLPNVYAGDSALPGNLNQTHNASFEFRVGIAYQWKTNKGIDHYLSFLIGK
ncbi:hypothetical protein SAMN06265379_101582 [Saccharicrinis carchari]|uniref:Outer membrane protein beta-barrel domain-containing protein n=1 Tax=Saccharicrinis carchari TaxID=1168039 RepID=A0A521B1I2_SACCC|nr:hypothetical protein SAMN06265379_101582 [Saccharicrinis carchari]